MTKKARLLLIVFCMLLMLSILTLAYRYAVLEDYTIFTQESI